MGEEAAEGFDTLHLDDEEEGDEDYTLQGQGHQETPHPRLRHGEVVLLVRDVWKREEQQDQSVLRKVN